MSSKALLFLLFQKVQKYQLFLAWTLFFNILIKCLSFCFNFREVVPLQEAFAVVREASKRVLGLRPFDVQLIGMVLH